MLKVISAFEWFRCVQNCSSYQKERIALQKVLTFLLEGEREGGREGRRKGGKDEGRER